MPISKAAKKNVFDFLRIENVRWWGRLGETAFLSRLYELQELPSTDSRFKNAELDIWQHRENNDDWEIDWVYTDGRFGLMGTEDSIFLRFLCEMLHPIVQPDPQLVTHLCSLFNDCLRAEGWEVSPATTLAGRPVFAARSLVSTSQPGLKAMQEVAGVVNADYIARQITRMETALVSDPELAIGTGKEFVETICKTILNDRSVPFPPKPEFPKLVRQTLKELELVPDSVPDHAKAADTIRVLLQNLASVANGLAEIRNPYGTGHGKNARTVGLQTRHARLAVGAASTLGVFLFETHQDRKK